MTREQRAILTDLIVNYGNACRVSAAEWGKGNIAASSDKEFHEMLDYLFSIEVIENV